MHESELRLYHCTGLATVSANHRAGLPQSLLDIEYTTSTICPLQAHLMISWSITHFTPCIVENIVHISRMLMQPQNLRLDYEHEDNNEIWARMAYHEKVYSPPVSHLTLWVQHFLPLKKCISSRPEVIRVMLLSINVMNSGLSGMCTPWNITLKLLHEMM